MSKNFLKQVKRWFILSYYKGCLKETESRISKGHNDIEYARRFFKFKIYKTQKSK